MINASELKYLCPNCFRLKTVNDVLFMRNAVKKGPDHIKRRYWRAFHSGEVVHNSTRCLADWRTYPQDMRIVRSGVVTGVIDYNGDRLEKRFCPDCRYSVYDPMAKTVWPLFWDSDGADIEFGKKAFGALRDWKTELISADPRYSLIDRMRAESPKETMMELPLGLIKDGRPVDEAAFDRYCRFSNAAVILVRLDNIDDGLPAADYNAIDTLLAFTAIDGARGERTFRPTTVLIDADDGRSVERNELNEWLKEYHHNFMNSLHALFGNNGVFIKSDLGSALEWLAEAANGKKAAEPAENR